MSDTTNDVFRIDRLTLRNFRCFEEKTIDFHPRFNVLIGDNGSGKTAVTDALQAGLEGAVATLVTGAHAESSVKEHDVRRVVYESKGLFTAEPQFPAAVHVAAQMGGAPASWRVERGPGGGGGDWTELSAPCAELRHAVSDGREAPLPLVASFAALRSWQHEKRPVSDLELFEERSRLWAYNGWWAPAASTGSLLKWLLTMEIASLQEGAVLSPLESVRAAIVGSVPRCQSVRFDVRQGELVVGFADGRRLPFNLLSHGVKGVLGMVADMAWRCAVLNPYLGADAAQETPGVVLIDEIDPHLHPSWQRHVVDDLKRAFPRVQFIVTTHSPFIIQSLEPGELYDLGSPDGEPRDEYADQSIEDIADKVQGVEQSAVSENRKRMAEAGRRYYELLAQAGGADPAERERLKRELDQIAAVFSDNVAYHAQLAVMQSDREAHGLGSDGQ